MCPSEKDAKEQVRNQEIRNLIERTKMIQEGLLQLAEIISTNPPTAAPEAPG